MAVYLTPGVYIEEIPSGARPIEGAATSVAAFVGPAVRGPAGEATRIGTLDDYKTHYGNIASEDDAMGLAVQSFYLNGGKTAYICRVAGNGSAAASVSFNREAAAEPVLVFSASSVGAWGEELFVMIEKQDPEALSFDVLVGHQVDGNFEEAERFADMNMRVGSDQYVVTTINETSGLVRVELGAAVAGNYGPATLTGGDTGTENDYFSAALGGATEGTLTLNLNGRGPESITIDLSTAVIDGTDHDTDGGNLATAVQAGILAHSQLQVFQDVTVGYNSRRFTITSPTDESNASLDVTGGTLGDLMLLGANARASLTSAPAMSTDEDVFSDPGAGIPSLASTEIEITIDDHGVFAVPIDVGANLVGVNDTDGALIAAALQDGIRAAASHLPSFAGATVAYDGDNQTFTIASGNAAPNTSTLDVLAGDLADFLGLSGPAGVAGREVTQGTAAVIPAQELGTGDQGARLMGGVTVAPGGADYDAFYDTVLRKVRDVTMILLPGSPYDPGGPTPAISSTIAFAERQQQMMLLLDPPPGQELLQGTDIDAFAPSTSTYSTMYYPWVRSPNPLYNVDLNPTADKTVLVQPSAFAAGLWTKTDGRRGVWKAPAGVETRLVGASALQFEVEDLEQSVLNPRGINCYRKMPTYGPVVWGARTLATRAVPEWRYVPVRRTALFIEKSIKDGIQWAVFQPNAHPLWGSLRANIGGFMDGLFRAGAFQGETANDAYFVRCNLGDTMTQADIDRGQVIVVVGFAPLKPAEFVIVRIQQKVGEQ